MDNQKNMNKKTVVLVLVLLAAAAVIWTVGKNSNKGQEAASIKSQKPLAFLAAQHGEKGESLKHAKLASLKSLPKYVPDKKKNELPGGGVEEEEGGNTYKDFVLKVKNKVFNIPTDSTNRLLNPDQKDLKATNIQSQTAIVPVSDHLGSDFSGYRPPDSQVAVGPNHVVSVVNSGMTIQTKTGTVLSTVSLHDMFSSLLVSPYFNCDPRIVYDTLSSRYIFSVLGNCRQDMQGNPIPALPPNPPYSLAFATSISSDPTAGWNLYLIPSTQFLDYDNLGVSNDKIVITVWFFQDSPQVSSKIWVLDKAAALSGATLTPSIFKYYYPYGDNDVIPALTFDNIGDVYMGNIQWTDGVWVNNGNDFLYCGEDVICVDLRVIQGPASSPTLVDKGRLMAINASSSTGSHPQMGGPNLPSNDARLNSFILRNNSLWMTANTQPYSQVTSDVWWGQLGNLTTTPSWIQQGIIHDSTNTKWYSDPSLAVNANGDVGVSFNCFSATTYPSLCTTARYAGDAPGTMSPVYVSKAGAGPYNGGSPQRWGDYSATVVDPVDNTFWGIGEIGSTTLAAWNAWLTHFSQTDDTGPVVSITAPANGDTVTGTALTVTATAQDNLGVSGVQFKLDGNNLGAEDTTAPYSITWNTTTATNGTHTLTAVARDTNNNSTISSGVSVTTVNTNPNLPVVSFTAPIGDTLPNSGSTKVTATATSPAGVAFIDSKLDGVLQKRCGAPTPSPCTYNLPASQVSPGTHTFTAMATTTSGLQNTVTKIMTKGSSTDTTPPTVSMTSPANNSTVSGTSVTLSATASDNVGVTSVQFKVDGTVIGTDTSSPYSMSWNTTTISNGSHSLTATASDAATNSTTSSVISVTVSNSSIDTTPPSVSITYPANAATLNGTYNITASAVDNVGVVGVQFKLDGNNLGAEDTVSPYSTVWNTTTTTNGTHILTAVARDAAGLTATSQPVSVTVDSNLDTTYPTITITAPANSSTVSGTITISANATDNVAVAGVQFKVDGNNIGSEDTTAPYSVSWNSAGVINGYHSIVAIARDTSNNTTPSVASSVTVSNGGNTLSNVGLAPMPWSITSSMARISWNTSTPSTTVVDYGLDANYGQTASNSTLVTYHYLQINGLTPSTTYHYRATSIDASANSATSGDLTFTTLAPDSTPPVITNLNIGSITSSRATITWATAEASTSSVSYGTTTSYGTSSSTSYSPGGPYFWTSHSVTLVNLSANTLYHIQAYSTDANQNTGYSTDMTFTTLP